MRNVFLYFSLFAVALSAQESKQPIQRVYDIRYADVKELSNVIAVPNTPMVVRFSEHFRTISVYGTPEQIADAEALIKRFDSPKPVASISKRNVELTYSILMASPKGSAGEAVPANLEPVVQQLKTAFGYNDFRLLDSSFIRAQEGIYVGTMGNTGTPNPDLPSFQGHYELRIQRGPRISSDEKGVRVRLDGFSFKLSLPITPEKSTDVVFQTDLDVREGQKVVVGKAKGDASSGAYILVLSARVVD